jgi:hypothetical protein
MKWETLDDLRYTADIRGRLSKTCPFVRNAIGYDHADIDKRTSRLRMQLTW